MYSILNAWVKIDTNFERNKNQFYNYKIKTFVKQFNILDLAVYLFTKLGFLSIERLYKRAVRSTGSVKNAWNTIGFEWNGIDSSFYLKIRIQQAFFWYRRSVGTKASDLRLISMCSFHLRWISDCLDTFWMIFRTIDICISFLSNERWTNEFSYYTRDRMLSRKLGIWISFRLYEWLNVFVSSLQIWKLFHTRGTCCCICIAFRALLSKHYR